MRNLGRLSIPLLVLSASLCGMPPALSASTAAAQAADPGRPTSTPYTGDLSVFEYQGRDEKLQIGRVMDLLGIKPGSAVADLGAGSGWFTVRAAVRVGANGTVFAEDINPEATAYIDGRLRKSSLTNVRTVLGTPDNPRLLPHSVDSVLILKVYHEIAHPQTLLANLKPALRPGAKVGIIDRNGNGADHGLDQAVVEREMSAAGFRRIAHYDFTKADGQDYFLIFEQK
jgi:predicted methyltransferase